MHAVRGTLFTLTTLAVTSLVSPLAAAESIAASDCNLDFKTSYNKGDAVCVTGEFDQVPPMKICAEAYVYVIPVDAPNPFADVTGAPNYVLGCGGAGSFIDEYVWLPPLKSGQYEFTIDNYPFFKDQGAAYDPGDDSRSGYAFTVTNAPTVFSVDPGKIKAAAAQGLLEAAYLNLLAQTLGAIDTISTVVDWWISFGGVGGLAGGALGVYCTYTGSDCPTSYNSAIITIGNKIISGVADSLTKKYDAIILDPPDPDFKAVVALDFAEVKQMGYPWTPGAERELPRGQIAIASAIALQSVAYTALVPSMEKVQGAKAAGDNLWQLLHAEKVEAYARLALDAGDRMLTEADALEAYLAGHAALDLGLAAAEFNASVAAVKQGGFTQDERNYLRSFGAAEADIDKTAEAVAAQATVPEDITVGNLLARARASYLALKPALQDLVAQAQAVQMENAESAFRPGPALSLQPAPVAVVGVPVMLAASATHFDADATLTYAWDLDLDGQYDDGQGPQVPYTPVAPGVMAVAARVSDGGNVDHGFLLVEVKVGNTPPELTGVTPVDPAPFADMGEAVALHVDASDADDDPLIFAWQVDGQPGGDGTDLMFVMPDEEAHRISVVVADDDAYSPDARMTWVVRAAKWESMVPDPTGDPTGSGTTDDPTGSGTTGTGAGTTEEGDESDTPTSGGGGATGDTTTDDGGLSSDGAGATGEVATGEGGGCGCNGGGAGAGSMLALALLGRRRRRAAGGG